MDSGGTWFDIILVEADCHGEKSVPVESCFSHVEPGKIWITTELLWMAWRDARGNQSVIEVARVD